MPRGSPPAESHTRERFSAAQPAAPGVRTVSENGSARLETSLEAGSHSISPWGEKPKSWKPTSPGLWGGGKPVREDIPEQLCGQVCPLGRSHTLPGPQFPARSLLLQLDSPRALITGTFTKSPSSPYFIPERIPANKKPFPTKSRPRHTHTPPTLL